MKNISWYASAFLLLTLCAWYGYRHTPQICGQLIDPKGQPVVGASICLLRDTTAIAVQRSDKTGKFCVATPPGQYTLEIVQEGFAYLRITHVPANESEKTDLHTILLEKADSALTESITVRYRPPLFRSDEIAYRSTPGAILSAPKDRTPSATVGEPRRPRFEERNASKFLLVGPTESRSEPAEGVAPDILSVTDDALQPPHPTAPKADRPARRPTLNSVTATRPGQLTAGEWNDLHNWATHWSDLLRDGDIDEHQKTYRFYPKRRYSVLLHNEAGLPVSDALVRLFDQKGAALWEARTSNMGQAELWEGLFDDTPAEQPLRIVAEVAGKEYRFYNPVPFEKGLNRYAIPSPCYYSKTVDIVWTVDATGSMGDEIDYLKTELLDVIGRIQKQFPTLDIRMGSVFYRDEGDEYLVKSSALCRDIDRTVDYIRRQQADGGGDYPEAVHSALEETLRQPWSREAVARICFLILDASPHQRPEVIQSLHQSIREAARRGVRIVPIACSGVQKDTEFLMKFFGLSTNGSYVFLTDHSGIGDKHLAPTADVYKVELLNDLLVRLIGEYIGVPSCDDGKSTVVFQTQPDPQSPIHTLPPARYYPNPATAQFTLELPFDTQKVALYNAEGQAARNVGSLSAGTHTIAVGDLPSGIYTLRIWKDNQIQSGKLLLLPAR